MYFTHSHFYRDSLRTCIRASVRRACDQEIIPEELIEFLEVAMTMQSCSGEEWALKAYAMYKNCVSGNQPVPEAACYVH